MLYKASFLAAIVLSLSIEGIGALTTALSPVHEVISAEEHAQLLAKIATLETKNDELTLSCRVVKGVVKETPKEKTYKEMELGGVAKTCEMLGAKTITSAADCQEASTMTKTSGATGGSTGYGGVGNWCATAKAPDGCYHTNAFWFNQEKASDGTSSCLSEQGINPAYLNGRWNDKPLRIVCIE